MNAQLATYISRSQKDLAIGISEDQATLDKAERLLVKGCTNDDDLQEFADTIAVLDKRSRAVLKARANFVEPFKKDIREVEKEFNEHKTDLDKVLKKLTEMFIEYQIKLKERLEREAAERRERQRKEEAERLAQEQAEAAKQAELDAEEAEEMDLFGESFVDPADDNQTRPQEYKPEPAQVEVIPPEKPLSVSTPKIKTESGASVKVKQEPIPIIKDKKLVPEVYKEVNLRKLINAYECGVREIPGVEFVLKNKMQVR